MIKKSPICILLIFLCVLTSGQTSAANSGDLTLRSLAVQEKYREPIFYAATYAKDTASIDTELDLDSPFRMEARFIVDKYSARQNHQLWIGAILINNTRDSLKPLSEPMLKFSSMMKSEFVKGDQLIFDYQPGKGTEILINGVRVGQILQAEFQAALAASWFGNRPPSKAFANDIRKYPGAALLAEYRSLSVAPSRINQVRATYAPKRPTQKSSTAVAQTKAESKPPVTSNNKPVQVAKADTSKATKKQTTPAKKPVVTQKPPVKVATKNTSAQSKAPAKKTTQPAQVAKQTPSKKQPVKVAKLEPAPADKKLQAKKPEDSATEVDVFDRMLGILTQDYLVEVKSYIESNAQPVPPIRVRKKPKDKTLVKLTIERDGETVKVVSSEIIRGELSEPLQKAVHKSIDRLKRVPPFPESLITDQLNIEVEIGFDRCKRSISAWVCF